MFGRGLLTQHEAAGPRYLYVVYVLPRIRTKVVMLRAGDSSTERDWITKKYKQDALYALRRDETIPVGCKSVNAMASILVRLLPYTVSLSRTANHHIAHYSAEYVSMLRCL